MLLFRFLNRCHNLLGLPEVKLVLGCLALLSESAGYWDLGAAYLGLMEDGGKRGWLWAVGGGRRGCSGVCMEREYGNAQHETISTLEMILVFPYKCTIIPANKMVCQRWSQWSQPNYWWSSLLKKELRWYQKKQVHVIWITILFALGFSSWKTKVGPPNLEQCQRDLLNDTGGYTFNYLENIFG